MARQLTREDSDLRILLEHIRDEYHGQAHILSANEITEGGFLGFGGKKRYVIRFEVPDIIYATRPAPAAAGPARGMAALLAAADAGDEGKKVPEPALSTERGDFASMLSSVAALVERPAAPTSAPTPVAAVAPTAGPGVPIRSVTGTDRAALAQLGLPGRFLRVVDSDGPVPLSAVFATLPKPPALTRESGQIVVVLGDARTLWPVAQQMAARLRLDPADVITSGDLSVPGVERVQSHVGLSRLQERVAAGGHSALVAIGVGSMRDDWAAAAALLDAVRADRVWAVVDARHNVRDSRSWLEAIAGRRGVDAVAATNVFEAAEPAAVLDLGVPVGWVDGLPASSVAWTAVLADRLGDAARWD